MKSNCIRWATVIVLAAASSLAFGQSGYLRVKTSTGRAGVFVDDKYVGPAANFGITRKYTVAAGEHTVTLREPRYESFTTKVTIVAGKTETIKHPLNALPVPKPPFGRLRTEGPEKYAAVYINGEYMGHVDEFDNSSQALLLPPGAYSLKIVPVAGGSPFEQKIELKANETTVVKVPGKA